MTKPFKAYGGKLRWGWKAILLIGGTILFGIILNTVSMTVLVIRYSYQGLTQTQAVKQALYASEGFVLQTVMSVLQLLFMLCLIWWLIVRIEKQKFDWSKLGLIPGNRSTDILLGIMLAVVLSLLTVCIGYFAGTLQYGGSGFELFTPSQILTTLLFGAVLAIASGFGEEIAFRGYLQSCIAERYNPTSAIVIVAVLFAFSHPIGNVVNPLLYWATAVLVGILFGTIFARTGTLWIGIALHIVWNYLQVAVFAIHNSADERFFGAPLFVFYNVSGAMQMTIEFIVILAGLGVLTRGVPVAIKQPAAPNTK